MSKIKDKLNNIKTKSKGKTVQIILMAFSLLMIVILVTPFFSVIRNFIFGVMGLLSYPFFIVLFTIAFAMFQKRKYVLTKKYVAYLICATSLLILLIQVILSKNFSANFFSFLADTYNARLTAGGIIFGIIVYPFKALIGYVGSIIVFSILFVFFTALIVDYLVANKGNKKFKENKKSIDINEYLNSDNEVEKTESISNNQIEENVVEEDNKSYAKSILGLNNKKGVILTNNTNDNQGDYYKKEKNDIIDKKSYILSTPPVEFNITKKEVINEDKQVNDIKPLKKFHDNDSFVNVNNNYYSSNNKSFIEKDEDSISEVNKVLEELKSETRNNDITEEISSIKISNLDNDKEISIETNIEKQPILNNVTINKPSFEPVKIEEFINKEINNIEQNDVSAVEANKETKPYVAPPIELLKVESASLENLQTDVEGKKIQLENALEQFRVPAKVINTVVGPAVTRYELEMPPGISVKKLITYQDDIALTLASNGGIRIEAPIPGRSAVGVEVPNEKIATIGLKDVINTPEFLTAKSPLTVALGKDINGIVRLCNLAKAPHLLVAGSTNSGKSVCLNAILISLLYRCSPNDLKLILVDPKRVEFSIFNGLPHLIMPNVICDNDKAINAFNWTITEMEKRYVMFQNKKVRNIEEYNNLPEVLSGEITKMPFIVFIVDELCDLMSTNKKEIEDKILRLTQKARAAGIHLILATQRPSVDVITGTIKNNLNSRIAFAVTSFADSKTILDQGGAEKLLGRGDMLYHPSDAAEPRRIQGAYVTGSEVESIVEFIKQNNESLFDNEIEKNIISPEKQFQTEENKERNEGFDVLLKPALKYFIENNQASISLIQRKFTVGFPRAARIIDQMEQAKFISPSDGSKPRTVLINMDDFNEYFGEEE